MGKISKRRLKKSVDSWKGWRLNTPDGHFFTKLFETGQLSPAAMLAWIKEHYPQVKKYKKDSLSSGVRRLMSNLGLNTRHGKGKNTGK